MAKQYIDSAALETIRAKLWATAQEKGITLEEIQKRTGFSYSQVYRIIRGAHNFSISHLLAICSTLDISPKELF